MKLSHPSNRKPTVALEARTGHDTTQETLELSAVFYCVVAVEPTTVRQIILVLVLHPQKLNFLPCLNYGKRREKAINGKLKCG